MTQISLKKHILITGATSGIGKVAAIELAKSGHHISIIGRDAQRAQQTMLELRRHHPSNEGNYYLADLANLSDIKNFAMEFKKKHQVLDVLINNAGALFMNYVKSNDGIEMTMALNHFSYFYLTHLLWPVLQSTAEKNDEARIINVSSNAHKAASRGIRFNDFNSEVENYSGWEKYGESKLANLYFTYALNEKRPKNNVCVNALHPGFVDTGFGANNQGIFGTLFALLKKIFARNEFKGAETSIFLAQDPSVKGQSGKYFFDKEIHRSNKWSYNREAQERFWNLSLLQCNIKDYFHP